MLTKQGDSRNKIEIKRITFYALLVAVCLIIGYLENSLSIALIAVAPGVKIGLSNAIALVLVYCGDVKGAWKVNIARICLSALLFGSPVSLVFSLSGGMASLVTATVISKYKSVSEIGVSIASATAHNIFQCIAAYVFVGAGVFYYLPALLLCGVLCGALCGVLVKLIYKKIKTKSVF